MQKITCVGVLINFFVDLAPFLLVLNKYNLDIIRLFVYN
jgi:hypothetical protein